MSFALSNTRRLAFRNDDSEAVPPFCLLRPDGVTLRGTSAVVTAEQPNADGQSGLLVNGVARVASGAYGEATYDEPWIVAYNTSDGTPAVGEVWGAKSGEWKLRKGYGGFVVIGQVTSGLVLVRRDRPDQHWWGYTAAASETTITSDTLATVTLNTEGLTSSAAVFTLSSNELTIDVAGKYSFLVSWFFIPTSTALRCYNSFQHNGSTVDNGTPGVTLSGLTANEQVGDFSRPFHLSVAAGDVFRLQSAKLDVGDANYKIAYSIDVRRLS